MAEKSPSFQFYVKDWLSDMTVKLMPLDVKGAYIELLCVCWNEGFIPNDDKKIAKILQISEKKYQKNFKKLLSVCFSCEQNDEEKLINLRLKVEKEKQEKNRKKRAEAGKKGMSERWKDGKKDDGTDNKCYNKTETENISGKNSVITKNNLAIPIAIAVPITTSLIEKKNTKKEKDQVEIDFDEMWKLYPKKSQEKRALKNYKSRRSKGFSKDELLLSVKTYVESCKIKETENDYMKLCSNFFSADNFFKDYLEGGYEFENLKNPVQNRKVEARTLNEDIAEWSKMIDDGDVVIKPI